MNIKVSKAIEDTHPLAKRLGAKLLRWLMPTLLDLLLDGLAGKDPEAAKAARVLVALVSKRLAKKWTGLRVAIDGDPLAALLEKQPVEDEAALKATIQELGAFAIEIGALDRLARPVLCVEPVKYEHMPTPELIREPSEGWEAEP